MKTHTTNCINTFIAIADDCPIDFGEVPPVKGDKKSAANIHYDMISKHPYEFILMMFCLTYMQRRMICMKMS